MKQFTNLFVVFDPTRDEQLALERAAAFAVEHSASLHLFACIYSDVDQAADKAAEIKRLLTDQQAILERAVAPLSGRGIQVSTEVEWDSNWCQAVVRASIKRGADVVLKSSHQHSAGKRMLNRIPDRALIRECPCPVLLVKESGSRDVSRVLAAVDMSANTETYERLNKNVIEFSKQVIDRRSAEVHFISAFQDFKAMPDRQKLIRGHGIASDKILIKLGDTDKLIVEHAKKLDVGLVVLGNSARSGLSAALVGNTVEKVLDKLECDVLSMP